MIGRVFPRGLEVTEGDQGCGYEGHAQADVDDAVEADLHRKSAHKGVLEQIGEPEHFPEESVDVGADDLAEDDLQEGGSRD